MSAAIEVMPSVGAAPILDALGLSRATYYRHRKGADVEEKKERPTPARALSHEDREKALSALHAPEYVDKAPAEVHASLLSQGEYICSVRTMYRILAACDEVRERRNQLRHPVYAKPQLLADAPNQVYTWDITKLLTFEKFRYLYLYVVVDIFSRYVVGWLIAESETAALAQRLIQETIEKQGIEPGQVTLHSDRGSQMRALTTAQLCAKLGVEQSFNRPHTSNDNPFSEAQFKTLKYNPWFPGKFGGVDEGLAFCKHYFGWYNNDHHHSGIAYLTPADVHYGRVEEVLAERDRALAEAYARHPERFVNGPPRAKRPPTEVYINPPSTTPAADADGDARADVVAEGEDSPSMAPLDAAASTETRLH